MNDLFIQAIEMVDFRAAMRTAVKIIGRRFARTEFSGNTCSRRYLSDQEVDGSIEVRTSGPGIRVRRRVMRKNRQVLKSMADG